MAVRGGMLLGVDAAVPGGGGGPWALVAHAAQKQRVSNSTPGINTSGATVLVVAVAWYNGGPSPAVTDSYGNTWHALTAAAGGNGSMTLFYALSPTVGAGHVFTIATPLFSSLAVGAWSGGGSAFGQQAGAGSASAPTQQPGSVTPALSNELLVSGICFGGTAGTLTIDSGFTVTDVLVDASGTDFNVGLAYLNQGTAAAENPTWTRSGSGAERMAAAIATFTP